MFRINRRTDYAVRVMLCLARREEHTRVPALVVQREMQIPAPYLRRIIADLSREGLILTYVGPNGGMELARPAQQIRLRHIWEAIEGPIMISNCLTGEHDCPLETGCPVNGRWSRLQDLILEELDSTNLAELADEAGHLSGGIPFGMLKENLLTPISANPSSRG